MSQVRENTPSKLSSPPNLPIFSGQEPVPTTEGSIGQWLLQVEGALQTHTEEAVQSAVIGSVKRCSPLTPRVHRLWRGTLSDQNIKIIYFIVIIILFYVV